MSDNATKLAESLEEENLRLKQWIADLQSGMYINCVYCGHRYGPTEDTPAVMADILKEHIEQCPEHPMSKLKREKDELQKDIDYLLKFENRPWSIQLLAPTEKDPFRKLDCIVFDVGKADKIMSVHCETLNNEVIALRKAVKCQK